MGAALRNDLAPERIFYLCSRQTQRRSVFTGKRSFVHSGRVFPFFLLANFFFYQHLGWAPREVQKNSVKWRHLATALAKGGGWFTLIGLWSTQYRMMVKSKTCEEIVPAGSLSHGGDVAVYVFWHKLTELAHSFLFCSCVCFCLYGPFNCISFHKFSRQLSAFSHCSFGLISVLLVLSTIISLMKVSLSPDIIFCG